MNPNLSKILARSIAVLLMMAMLPGTALPALAAPGDTTRVSVDSAGAQANDWSTTPAISSDGRFVAFDSVASNLVAGDTGGSEDIFLRDRQTGETTRVSVNSSGAEANNGSSGTAISGDGRFVAFASDATNLVSGDTNGMMDIFVRDRQTGTTTRASVNSSGEQANDNSDSFSISISSDGRFVAFHSDATNLVSGDTNGLTDVFVHDNQTGATERISLASDGTQANAGCSDASISADGRYVAFTSGATNLVSGDLNGSSDVFVRDRQIGLTTRVSVNSSGVEADKGARDSSISGDGRYVTFSSFSNNLMSEDTFSLEYVYVHDRQAGTTTLVSRYSDGYQMVGRSEQSAISADGRYVAFQFDDKGDGMAYFAIYVHDLQTGATVGAATRRTGNDDAAFLPVISADGRFVAFASNSRNIAAGDTNGTADVFLHEVAYGPDLSPTVVSVNSFCGSGCKYPSPASASFRVTFSEFVTGVTTDDFAVTTSGGVSGAAVTGISGSANQYTVTVGTGTGEGNLRLDVLDDDSIKDISLNPLGGPGAGNGNFNTAAVYIVDKSLPVTTGILRVDPTPTAADSVHFTATFSEEVSGVDASDFTLALTGGITGATVTGVSGLGNTYTVTVSTGTGDGTLRLDLVDNDSIVDVIANPLGGTGAGNANFTSGETYTINKNAPIVTSSLRADPSPTAADSVHFTVTFSENVTGVDSADFAVSATGLSGAGVLELTGSGNVYAVTVVTGSGDGTLRLDVLDNDSILDSGGLPLGGTGAANGNFTTGEAYTVTKTIVTPIATSTETFRSNGTNDGWVLESSENSNVGGSVNSTAKTFNLGDDAKDRQFRAILHFPTFYLPDNAVVTRVILMIKGQGVVGTDPFTTHQNIQIDICNCLFGFNTPFGFRSLQPVDFEAAASRGSVGTIVNNPVGGWYWSTLDHTAFPYINLSGVTQLRLGFQLDDNDDMGDDYIKFYSGNREVQADRPQLLVEYYQ